MKIVSVKDAPLSNPPMHYDVESRALQGIEPSGFFNQLILGHSRFQPGGYRAGAEMRFDAIYYILEGELTVRTKDRTEILRQGDTVRFEMNEWSEVKNEGVSVTEILAILAPPPAKN